jgi:hypothetical protein
MAEDLAATQPLTGCYTPTEPTGPATPTLPIFSQTTQDLEKSLAILMAVYETRSAVTTEPSAPPSTLLPSPSPLAPTTAKTEGSVRSDETVRKRIAVQRSDAQKRRRANEVRVRRAAETSVRRAAAAMIFRDPDRIALGRAPTRASLLYVRLATQTIGWQVQHAELHELFCRFGPVHMIKQVPEDSLEGHCVTEYVIVSYYSKNAARYAVERLHMHHRTQPHDALLSVTFAREQPGPKVDATYHPPNLHRCMYLCNFYLGFDGLSLALPERPHRGDTGTEWRCRAEVHFKRGGRGGRPLVVAGVGSVPDDDEIHDGFKGSTDVGRRAFIHKVAYSRALLAAFGAVDLRVAVDSRGNIDNHAVLASSAGSFSDCGSPNDADEDWALPISGIFRVGTSFVPTYDDRELEETTGEQDEGGDGEKDGTVIVAGTFETELDAAVLAVLANYDAS